MAGGLWASVFLDCRRSGRLVLSIPVLLIWIVSVCKYAPTRRLFAHLEVLPDTRAPTSFDYFAHAIDHEDKVEIRLAKNISPRALLARTRSRATKSGTKSVPVIHQTWKSSVLPEKYQRWSRSWRLYHPDWSHALWTHQDLRELIAQEFGWFLKTYDALPGQIYRVDVARNALMYIFGGMYADLDFDCLGNFDTLLGQNLSDKNSSEPLTAWFGTMSCKFPCHHSIPNAWMAAEPGHPFFLLPMLELNATFKADDGREPEDLTGPVALRRNIFVYRKAMESAEGALTLFQRAYELGADRSRMHQVNLLQPSILYPYSWQTRTQKEFDACQIGRNINEDVCHEVMQVRSQGSLAITYWTHDWNARDP